MSDQSTTARVASEGMDAVLRSLRKHWMLGSVVAASVLACTVFYTIGQKRIYRATATVQIDPTPPRPLGKDIQAVVDMGAGTYWTNKEYFGTQLELLKGKTIAIETARMLGLHNDAAFMANLPVGIDPPRLAQTPTLDNAADALIGRLAVEPVRDSRLVVVKVEDANPDRARRILAALLDIFLERNVNQTVTSTIAATEWLRNQTEKLKTELEDSELALHDYKKDKRILSVSLDDQSNMLRGEMQQLSAALTKVNAHREELQARVHALDKIDLADPIALPSVELLSSAILTNLRQEYVRAKGEYESLLGEGKGEKYPQAEATHAKVESTRQALFTEVKNVQGALRNELLAATGEARGLSGLFEQAKQRALDLNMLEIEYRRLERSKDNTEKLFGMVLERSKETDLTGMLRFNNIAVVEVPICGLVPVRPRVPINLAIGLMLGLVLGVAAAFSREWLDRTIRNAEDAEDAVGVSLLGILPALSGKVATSGYYSRQRSRRQARHELANGSDAPVELIVHALPASNAAECARGVRTSLTFASLDKPHKSILVTSASPSEGKTMVASTIAVVFAQAGQRVLLVDCDLRRARLHRVFRTTSAAGVSSVLQDPASLDQAIVATEVPGLMLLAAGPHVPNPAEVLQGESFRRLLQRLTEKFDRVVVDSPPVLAVTDAAVLGAQVDATVVVLRARKTRRDVARLVVKKMTDLGATVVGVVLNAMEEPRKRGGYYYGYYSRQNYGQKSESDSGDQSAAAG